MKRVHSSASIVTLAALAVAVSGPTAWADNKTVKFETWSCKPGTVTITYTLPPNAPVKHEIEIPRAMTAEEKARFIAADLLRWDPAGRYAALGSTVTMIKDERITVEVSSGTTQEAKDILSCAVPGDSVCSFTGFFDPFDPNRQPAIFTAGIVTDVGELTARVSAQELNFQTDGPIICQALFQRLAPRAPQYGAEINYAGDRLEIYFDPAYSVTQGGVVFGTTSPSPGASGTLALAPPDQPGGHCTYIVTKSKATGGCQSCPPRGFIVRSLDACDDVDDCRKKSKGTIPCPDGQGSCTVTAKRRACE